jgi:hypothetical protein
MQSDRGAAVREYVFDVMLVAVVRASGEVVRVVVPSALGSPSTEDWRSGQFYCCIDDASRIAFVQVMPDDTRQSAVAFLIAAVPTVKASASRSRA